ncbi:DUF6600 domain-containing protein [Chryseolinea sp. H1M3-3]|uniref:DUF6600 domain-containing protein n=1 Tax=Chryseolinea sp. H1M3-3 TaxID=3034144 RepID=UPI0023ECAB64|nr:DUF6600 domain-containing protein [Chryseolinea sp. H1M3-3]
MKKLLNRGWMVMLVVMLSAFSISDTKAQSSVSLQVFYDELQPYGTWMDHGQHGYVWMPRVGPDFVPYATNGYWIQTEYGNTWVSDYNWGWAPFHYGRWFFDDFYGWMWVPDTTWGPAWVAWRSGGGYYGWAPLMPGIGVHLSFHYYDRIPHHYWNFVPYQYVTYRHVQRHCLPRPRVVNVIHHTTIITHNHIDNSRNIYFTGPDRREIERHRGGRVEMHSISDQKRPGRTEVSERTANFYRPNIDGTRESRSTSVPSTYVRKDRSGNLEQIHTRNQRSYVSPENKNTDAVNPSRTEQRQSSNGFRSLERERYNPSRESVPTRDMQRNEYTRQRNQVTENEMPARNYRQVERQPENNARDRYEAPPIERAPAQRQRQQRNYESQQQQWQQPSQRQNTTRQRENVNIQRERFRENTSRSQMNQSQGTREYRKSDSGNSNRQPSKNTNAGRLRN